MAETLKQAQGTPAAEPPRNSRFWTRKNILAVTIIAFLFVLFIRVFVFETFLVRGDSMSPTIMSGQLVFVDKLAYIRSEPKRGDIVIAVPRVHPGRVVKRVIGLPGEWFSIENGTIVIKDSRTDEGVKLDEKYLKLPYTPEVGTTRTNLDPEEYFALGDNREVSIDSRELGPIDLWDVKGKVVGVFDFGTLRYKAF